MRHNGRTPLLASKIPATEITLLPGQPIVVICPDCHTWRTLHRHMIRAHRMEDHGHGARNRQCPGSGQRIKVDVTLGTWTANWTVQQQEASTDAAASRPTRPTPKPHARKPTPAVTQMDAVTRQLRGEITAHQADCIRCRTGRWCEPVSVMRRKARRMRVAAVTSVPLMTTDEDGNRRLPATA